MRIGFFGDSYVDVFLRHEFTKETSWSFQLLQDLDSPVITTGYSGTSQYHSIVEWNKFCEQNSKPLDFAIWTFTWENRLYSSYPMNSLIFSAVAEKRMDDIEEFKIKHLKINPHNKELLNDIINFPNLYFKVYDLDLQKFTHELMIKYILELSYTTPETKFIFIPNTELSNTLAKKHFKTGILLDFAFETLSNLEPDSPGPMPVNCGRIGHINKNNRIIFKDQIKEIIENYETLQNSIYKIDYNKFDIVK